MGTGPAPAPPHPGEGRFDPSQIEPRWTEAWRAAGVGRADPARPGPAFSMAIPPPNVTGVLHMGHALNNTIQDLLVRWRRMAGDTTMWICGTDHAGIATQAVVEKALAAEGVSRAALGREEFVRRVWRWREEYGGRIIAQLTRLGCTLDYSRERFTMDDDYARAVLRVFVALHEQGLVYRDRYLVNWDPGLGSAISDLEVEEREVTDTLVEIAYPVTGQDREILVATVRPETMLGDTAVAVSPGDPRYADLVGLTCTLPLVGRQLPIVADEAVDPEFGTGALKVTPAHAPEDFDIARRHDLPAVGVIGEDGRMTAAAGGRYSGLRPDEARQRVVSDLRALGLIRGERPYIHTVPFSHRSGARVEPLISLQWFCDMTALAQPAIAAVEDGRVRFHPATWGNVYLRWMGEIRPWCVSRQLWWGHRLPVWYRGEEAYVGLEEPEGEGWERDPDVLDTWFSSALWPFATLGWPEETPELRRFYPTRVVSTARDIIFLWVARMVMMGLRFRGQVPFADVYIHSVVQAPDGRRMSKSLGTGVDPLDLVATHGADALRFGLLMMSSTQDVRFSEDRVRQGRQLATKLWHATRLVVERGGRVAPEAPPPATPADRWIASRTTRAIAKAEELVGAYELSRLADLLYHLVFDDFCDWYLELLKAGAASPETAGDVLEQLLALLHPLMPFVTEECHARLPGASGLMAEHPPGRPPGPVDDGAEAAMEAFREQVAALRKLREERGLRRRDPLAVDFVPDPALAALTGAVHAEPGASAILAVTVDPAAERARLDREIARAEAERARAERQLANPGFAARAPAHLVEAERQKAARFAGELERLQAERDAVEER